LNIRGVGNIIDRGTAAIVLNTEYRYTLYEKGWFSLKGNTFIDGVARGIREVTLVMLKT
jgi:hypothetical protein